MGCNCGGNAKTFGPTQAVPSNQGVKTFIPQGQPTGPVYVSQSNPNSAVPVFGAKAATRKVI
jgi:hypothetical protein